MKRILAVFLMVGVAVSASAQLADEAKLDALTHSNSLGIKPASSSFSLVDWSRVRWSHSYSLSFLSGSGYSGSVGLLQSSMLYELSPSLSLGLNLGIAHNAGALWRNGTSGASFLPGFWLDFHPSEKFRMGINVQWYDGAHSPFMSRSRYWPRYMSPY
jgi:hypothetical protein